MQIDLFGFKFVKEFPPKPVKPARRVQVILADLGQQVIEADDINTGTCGELFLYMEGEMVYTASASHWASARWAAD